MLDTAARKASASGGLTETRALLFAGLLLARTTPWTDNETIRLSRMAETVGHSWLALTGGKPVRRFVKLDTKTKRKTLPFWIFNFCGLKYFWIH